MKRVDVRELILALTGPRAADGALAARQASYREPPPDLIALAEHHRLPSFDNLFLKPNKQA